jgi:hypothetical protein
MAKAARSGRASARAKARTTRTRSGGVRPFGQRSTALEWRRQWFTATRSADESALGDARDAAIAHKLALIEELGRDTGAIAGYDPAGAGSPWYPIGPRNVNGRVKALAVHPTDPDTVYAGAASGGVWKSVDGGQTWDPLWDMQESLAIGAIGIAQSHPQTVYAGTGEWTPGFGASYPGAGVYVSTDGGGNWSVRNACRCRRIGKLVVHPTNPQRVWICGDAGLERTDDGGATWTLQRSDMVTDIALDPTNASTVFVAVAGSGFFKSTTSGASFTALAGSPTGPAAGSFPQIAIGFSGAHGHNFIVIKTDGTVSTSTNGGTTFTTVSSGHGGYFGWCDVIACAPDDESILFYGGVGLERSTDGGSTWSGLPVHADQHAAVCAPSTSSVVYFANDGGVWRSDDKGATVQKMSNGLVITQFYNLGFWPTLSNVIGGGAQDNATNYTTSGLTWQPVWTNDGGWFVIDPTDPRTMYAEGQNAYLAKSTDGGTSWTATTSGISGSSPWEGILTMDPNDHLRLYYGTDSVLRTLDGCATAWTTVSQVLDGEVSSIAVAPSDSTRVYVGTSSGSLYRSDDGGNTSPWADKSAGLPGRGIGSIWIDPANENYVLISVGGLLSTGFPGGPAAQSVYLSINGGNAWTNVSGDLPVITANAAVRDPSSASTFYLATDGGVYRTVNGGTHWHPFDNGMPNVPVADLAVDPSAKILYAGTFGRGAYKLDITPGATKPHVDLYLRDDDLDTGERSPSPSGLPDPLMPSPATADWWTSPDIKVNHAPFYAPPGTVFDGVDFDTALVHQDPFRGQTNRIYLQVHNRGWQPTTNVSVRAFVADASLGLPALPGALVPPNFNLSSSAHWTPVGPAQTIPRLLPNRPVIVSWDFAFPAGAATHTCCLAVLSSADDPFNNTNTDIGTLVTGEKRACLKNLHIVDPGPAPPGMMMIPIDIHNAGKRDVIAELLVRPTLFDRGRVGLLLPEVALAKVKAGSVGVERVPLAPSDPVGNWYLAGGTSSEKALDTLWRKLDRTHIWIFSSTQSSRLAGLRLASGQTLTGVLVCSHKRDVPTRVAPRVTIEQRAAGRSVGGSTFQIGYDDSSTPAQPRPRRIRVIADRVDWREAERSRHARLAARSTIGDDRNRSSLRFVDPDATSECLYDGYIGDGDAFTLELIEPRRGADSDHAEVLYRRRFAGTVGTWLGRYAPRRTRDGLKLIYTIEDATGGAPLGAD